MTYDGSGAMPSPARAPAYIVSMWMVLSAGRCGTMRTSFSSSGPDSAW